MRKVLCSLLAGFSISAFAQVGDANELTTNQDSCIKHGGNVINGYLISNEADKPRVSPQLNACWFSRDGGELVSLNTLSKQPSFAATFILKVDAKGKDFPFGWDACKDLGGLDSAFYNNGIGAVFTDAHNPAQQYGSICMFADGSFTTGWTILYNASGAKQQAKNAIISQPINMPIPPIHWD